MVVSLNARDGTHPRKQGRDGAQLLQECCRDALGPPCVGRPDMIGQACRHRGGHRAPLVWRTDTACGFRGRHGCLSSPVGKPQMSRGPRHPPLLLNPHEVLGAGLRATGQASGPLALRAVSTFDKARVHRLTAGRGRPTWRHGVLGTPPTCGPTATTRPWTRFLMTWASNRPGSGPPRGWGAAPRGPCRSG